MVLAVAAPGSAEFMRMVFEIKDILDDVWVLLQVTTQLVWEKIQEIILIFFF